VLADESLSAPYMAFLDGLTAVHDGALAWTAGYGAKPEPGRTFPASEHPVVSRHPYTGRKFLDVDAAFYRTRRARSRCSQAPASIAGTNQNASGLP